MVQMVSRLKNAGTDGKDLGADMDALQVATAGVISGASGPPIPDTVAPTGPTALRLR